MAYLSGAMEAAPDLGREWRQKVKAFLQEELGHDIFDPTEQLPHHLTEEERESFRTWKTTDPEKFFPVIRRIIDNDLDTLTQKTDYVVCYWDEYVTRGAGTAAEISIAYMKKIPVYFITTMPLEEISSWAVGCATRVFGSFQDFFVFMREQFTPAM